VRHVPSGSRTDGRHDLVAARPADPDGDWAGPGRRVIPGDAERSRFQGLHVERALDLLRVGADAIRATERALSSSRRTQYLESDEPAPMRWRAESARAHVEAALARGIEVQEEHVRAAGRHGATAREISDASGWSVDRVDGLLRGAGGKGPI
jgi:hypothetical protein